MAKASALLVLLGAGLVASGCQGYVHNRYYDFRDIVTLGAGVTAAEESPIPPGFGLYAEATEFAHLGFMYFDGYMAEWDRRAMCLKRTSERKFGFGPFHTWKVSEDYHWAGAYKTEHMAAWQKRMDERAYGGGLNLASLSKQAKSKSVTAKRMQFHGEELQSFPRGWQDWGFIGLDAALSEPLLLHAGIKLRFGVDFSQVSDFVLGIVGIDFYGDDATPQEISGHAR